MSRVSLRYVIPPGKPEDFILRNRLCEELDRNKNKSLIVINTAAGYGKTLLLSDYSLRYLHNACWLNSPLNISSANELTHYLIYSLKAANKEFGSVLLDYLSLAETERTNSPAEIVNLFLNEFIKTFHENVTLIIDDFQNLELNNEEWINSFFNELFIALPQNFKIIISTRQKPGFKISRLEAKRNYFSLSTNDLAFSEYEIMMLINDIYNLKYTDTLISELKKRTNGWITALHLIIQTVDLNDLSGMKMLNSLYDYFAEDIFNLLESEIKEFIASTAILESFTAGFCNELMNINNSEKIIDIVLSKNIFLDTFTNDEVTYYCYQKLFSEFIEKYREKNSDRQKLQNILLRAAELYNNSGNFESAIAFYIKSGNPKQAVCIINSNFNDRLRNSDFRELKRWFDFFNEGFISSDKTLLYNYLRYCISINEIDNKTYSKIESLNETPDTGAIKEIKYILLKAEFFLITGNTDESLKILENLAQNNSDTEFLPEIYTLLTKAYYRKGFDYYEQVIAVGEKALEIITLNGSEKQKIEVINILGNLYFDKGENLTAIKYYEIAISNEQNIRLTLKIYSVLITLYSDIGDWDNSKIYIDKFKLSLDKISTPLFERLLLRSEAQLYFNLGDFNLALIILERINQNKLVQQNNFLLLSNLWSIVQAHYYQNDLHLANQVYEFSKKYFDNSDEYFIEMRKLFKFYYTNNNIQSRNTEEALLEVLDYHIKKKIFRFVAPLNFYLSNHYFFAGKYDTSLSYLKNAIDTFAQKNQLVWCSNELHNTRHLFDFAIANNLHKPFIDKIFAFTKEKISYDWLSPEFRAELTAKTDKLTDINFFPFGSTEFMLRGEQVGEDKWIRKKSKVLLAYLMSDPERIHTKDEIIDMFFDDMPADKADIAYHSTLYNIRTALKIYDIKTDKPKRSKDKTYDYNPQYILYEDKTIRLNPDFYYISANIEFEKLFSKSRLPSLSVNERTKYIMKAIEIYKGDFMPGYYDSWCEELRTKYKNNYIILCEEMVKYCMAENRFDDAVIYCEKLLRNDKLNEMAYVNLIRSHVNLGALNQAKGEYEKMLQIFKEEIDEEPSYEIMKQIKSIFS